jgi:hypothetical protein
MKLGKFLRFDPRYAGKGLMDGGKREFCRSCLTFFTRLRDGLASMAIIEKSYLAEEVGNMKVLLGLLK